MHSRILRRFTFWGVAGFASSAAAVEGQQPGLAGVDLIRTAAIAAVVLGVLILILTEFVVKSRISRTAYHWLVLFGLCVLPATALVGATVTMLEETKTVDSCAACHVMDPFVYDLQHEDSETLAARHYKNNWIPKNHCYSCHTTYGVHGAFEAKRDGFRHWLLYVTGTYEEPITYKGSFPNVSCLDCHDGTPKYDQVTSHVVLDRDLRSDRVSCSSCHGPAHPTPGERGIYEGELWEQLRNTENSVY